MECGNSKEEEIKCNKDEVSEEYVWRQCVLRWFGHKKNGGGSADEENSRI